VEIAEGEKDDRGDNDTHLFAKGRRDIRGIDARRGWGIQVILHGRGWAATY